MNWLIVITMAIAEPFAIPILEFSTKNECVDYVMNPANSDRLAIEIIGKAGFNDEIIAVLCLPETNHLIEREYEG